MTILPKKKQSKNTNEDDRDKEHSNERYNYGQINNTNQNGQISPNNRAWASRSEDKRSAPDSDCSSDHSTIGNSHLKRRHRTARERDSNSNLQRTLKGSVRSLSKSALNSPSSSPRDISNSEVELTGIPGCSSLINRDEGDISHSNMLVPVNIALREDEEGKKDASGYNSGDEYQRPSENLSNVDWEEKERIFERKLRKKGLNIKKMDEDGACLFRAVADQVYGDQDMHTSVRKLCMDYMEKNGDYYSQYVTEEFSDYIERKRSDHVHGNHIEIQALSEIFNRPIQVFHYNNIVNMDPINILPGCEQTDNEPIRLSYHRNVHYNSIVNPYKATIGVGLGLPSFKPGLAEKTLMEKAMLISEQHELEQAMLKDKIRATDWDATNEAIEEQIARESYLDWLAENELRSRKKNSTKSSATSTLTKYAEEESTANSNLNGSPPSGYSPRTSKSPLNDREHRNTRNSPEAESSKASNSGLSIDETSSFIRQVPPSVLGLNRWSGDEEDDILAHVLAQSQAEYIESLKSSNDSSSNSRASTSNAATSSESTATTSSEYFSSLPSTSSNYRS